MFIIKTFDSDYNHHVYDVKTGADVILGLTGDDNEHDRALAIMGNMCFYSMFSVWDKYTIICLPEGAGD